MRIPKLTKNDRFSAWFEKLNTIIGYINEFAIETDSLSPKKHDSAENIYGVGNNEKYGHLKLSDNVNDSANATSGIASAPLATKQAYDKAIEAIDIAQNALLKSDENSIEISHLQNTLDVNHASDETIYGIGTNSLYGHVQLSDDTNSSLDSTYGVAATPKAVSEAYALASNALPKNSTAASATKLANAMKITLGGDLSGSVSFDGSQNVTLTATVDNLEDTLLLKAPSASPAFTGIPTAPTATAGTNTTQIATTAFVKTAIDNKTSVSGNAGTATKLANARTIDGVSFDGSSNITHFGICSTNADSAEKIVTNNNITFKLQTGARITVQFSTTNTAENPTLNVNSTGARSIYYRGEPIAAEYLAAKRIYEFVYDGSEWEIVGDINTDTVYSLPTATSSRLGGVKIGSNISVSSGTISLTKNNVTSALGYTPPTQDTVYSLPIASSNTLGGIQIGSNITINEEGVVSISSSNVTSALGYTPLQSIPTATSSVLGGVKIGSNISVSSGTISLTKNNVTSALGYTPANDNSVKVTNVRSAILKNRSDIILPTVTGVNTWYYMIAGSIEYIQSESNETRTLFISGTGASGASVLTGITNDSQYVGCTLGASICIPIA